MFTIQFMTGNIDSHTAAAFSNHIQFKFIQPKTENWLKSKKLLGSDPSLENVYNNMDQPVQREFWHIHDPSRLVR